MKILGITITIIAAIAALTILKGYVFATLWLWFIVPVFALPAITTAQSVGIGTVISFATLPAPKKSKDDGTFAEKMTFAVSFAFVYPLFVLLIGWIVKQCL